LLESRVLLEIVIASRRKQIGLVGAVGIETTILLEIKEFCGARWPSKVLKRMGGNP
jgi:hypothetical protein